MNCNLIKRLALCFAIGFFTVSTIFLIGCAPKKVVVVHEEDGNHGHSEVNQNHEYERKGGPPPHAPAYGYRAKQQYHYRYYPSRSVYYDTGRRLYFYIKGNNWEVGASLPSSLRVELGEYVSMELDTDRPYIYHAEHVKKYPPGQMKKLNKKKNKWI